MRQFSLAVGVVFILVGVIWILQGVNVLRGSMMSGRLLYSWLGFGVAVVGIILLLYESHRRTRSGKEVLTRSNSSLFGPRDGR